MNIHDYFSGMVRGLKQRRITHLEPVVIQAIDDDNGLFHLRVQFWDNSLLEIREIVTTQHGYPQKRFYSYHYQKAGQTIFRYDNAPHHPEISSFPHHKHIGAREQPSHASPPTLSAVFDEIEGFLEQV